MLLIVEVILFPFFQIWQNGIRDIIRGWNIDGVFYQRQADNGTLFLPVIQTLEMAMINPSLCSCLANWPVLYTQLPKEHRPRATLFRARTINHCKAHASIRCIYGKNGRYCQRLWRYESFGARWRGWFKADLKTIFRPSSGCCEVNRIITANSRFIRSF